VRLYLSGVFSKSPLVLCVRISASHLFSGVVPSGTIVPQRPRGQIRHWHLIRGDRGSELSPANHLVHVSVDVRRLIHAVEVGAVSAGAGRLSFTSTARSRRTGPRWRRLLGRYRYVVVTMSPVVIIIIIIIIIIITGG